MALLPTRRSENPLAAFRGMLDDFFNEPFLMSDRDISSRVWPRVDITERKDAYIVRADLPGMRTEDIKVSLEGNLLTVSGEKQQETEREEGAYSHLERSYGSFQRSFTLPEYVDKESVDAKYANGVLELTMKKVGQAAPRGRQIEIKS
jgi:HSP20 family protein